MKSTYFSFRAKFYHLTDGVAMGSPASSVVANIFMEHFEEEALETAGELGIAPRVSKRYVDNVFSIFRRHILDQLMTHLNDQDSNIVFTSEEESAEGSLPFLDVNARRVNGKIVTGVYRKPTHTNRVLAFDSHHPLSAKLVWC